MPNFDYQEISKELLKGLDPRQKEIIARRFGLLKRERETLESIGKSYGLTRERVRQIQNFSLAKIKERAEKFQDIFDYFKERFVFWGNLKREDRVIENFGGEKFANQILFLLTLAQPFERKREDEEFYTLWLSQRESLFLAKRIIDWLEDFFKKEKRPFPFEELFETAKKKNPSLKSFQENAFISFIEATKKIEEGPTGYLGLSYWPEIVPRGVRDRAYLALKEKKTPLHFREITNFINEKLLQPREKTQKMALCQTVHNELIKDQRFVLVGRGIYALREWGFEDGTVKEIILKILQKKKKPLSKEEILEEVLKQRLVKENTILLSLSDKNYFQKTPQGKYWIVKC